MAKNKTVYPLHSFSSERENRTNRHAGLHSKCSSTPEDPLG